jgi:LysM repeat protein
VAVVHSPTPTLDAGPPDATPPPGPTPALSPEATEVAPTPPTALTFSSPEMGITLEYPETWYRQEEDNLIVFSPSETGLDPKNLKDSVFWVAGSDDPTISKLLTEALTNFPADAENLNEGTISIASQTWTSVQIRFKDKNLGQGIATVAVTGKEGKGYVIVAIAPAEQWNAMQPLYQGIINSFRFSSGAIAQATETQNATPAQTETKSSSTSAPTSSATKSKETTATAVPSTPTPTPAKATATPLVYVIQSGDTLLAVANQFGVDVDELAAKNGIDDPGKLSIGQELIIPFTAEELAAYNAGNGGRVTSKETTDKAATAATTTTAATESTAAETDTEKPAAAAPTQAPQSEAAPISGRVIYPAFNPGTNVYDLWMVDVATGEQTGVASEASQPDFSRDGSLLAYRSWGLGTRGIFFRDFVGGRGGQVTRFVEDGLPTWAPDGYTFAFASRREGDRVPRIYVGNQMGKEDYSIGFQGEYPATFPDGRLIVKGCLPSGDCGVFIMGPTGGGETKISSEVSDTAPAVSPDGNKIAFMSYGRGGGTNWELWVMNADGTNPQRLTDNHSNEGLPTWSPDGRSIAYVSDQDGAWSIWVMNADGSNQRRVALMKGSPDGKVLRDVDNSKGWLEERISWAP